MSTDRPNQEVWRPFGALRGGSLGELGRDLAAGGTLAAIAVPEQMATARLGGFAPEVGLVAFVAAALGFAVFGANRQLSSGADSTITPIFAGSLAAMAATGSAQYGGLAAVLALMVGAMLVLAGLLRLGWIANLLSTPVITGFLAGIALHIALSQAPSVLGLPEGSGDVFHRLASLMAQASRISPASTAIGLGVLVTVMAAEKLSARIPGALIALAAATLATWALHLERAGVEVLGQSLGALQLPGLPHLGFEQTLPLVGLALLISLVVMVQTAATTRSFSGPDQDPDVDHDYVGVGAGSALAGLFGAFPVDASPPRTAVVAETGGRSQWTGLVAACAVLVVAVFGKPLLAHIPSAALGGILLFVALRIFHLRTFADILRRTRTEFALAVLTTGLIVILPIQTGVAVGMFLSLAYGVFTITRARLTPFVQVPGTTVWWPASKAAAAPRDGPRPDVLVMGFQAPLSFLNAYDFRRGVLGALGDGGGVRLFVLEASSIVDIDFTASGVLADLIGKVRSLGCDFAVARLESVRAQTAFERFGLGELLGRDHLFHSVDEAVRALGQPAPGG